MATVRDSSRSRISREFPFGTGTYAVTTTATQAGGLLDHSLTTMKLYLFNLTNVSLFIGPEGSEHTAKLSVLPNAFAALPASEDNIILSSTGGDSEIKLEKASLGVEVERQYVINLKKSSFRWSPRDVSMPEDCPWRIYCDQVASSVLLWFSVKCP
jgi:hypothetical protein